MNKPREYWIDIDKFDSVLIKEPIKITRDEYLYEEIYLNVVEKSAYNKAIKALKVIIDTSYPGLRPTIAKKVLKELGEI